MDSRPVGIGEGLRLGFRSAWRAPNVVALGFLAEIGTDLLSLGVGLSLAAVAANAFAQAVGAEPLALFFAPEMVADSFLGQLLSPARALPVAGLLLVVALLSGALRLLWLTAGARTFALRLADQESGRGLSGLVALPRAFPVAALFLPVWLAIGLYNWAALGASTLAFTAALGQRSGGFTGALSLALAITLSALLSFVSDALFRFALVRSVSADVGPVEATLQGLRLFGKNALPVLVATFLFSLLAGVGATVGGAGGMLFGGEAPAALAAALTLRALSGTFASLVNAYFATAQLGFFAAYDAADRGVLPEPPAPPPPPPPAPVLTHPVLVAEPVLSTELVLPAEAAPLSTEAVLPTEPVLSTELVPPANATAPTEPAAAPSDAVQDPKDPEPR